MWGGRTAAERHAERRQRLIDAATEIWMESGWAAVTMRAVRAHLTERPVLLPEFQRPRRPALHRVGRHQGRPPGQLDVRSDRGSRPGADGHPGQGIAVVVERTAADPAGRRSCSAATSAVRSRAAAHRGAAPGHQHHGGRRRAVSEGGADEIGLRVDALVGIGGFVELITAWQSGLIDVGTEQIIAHCSRIGSTLASVYLVAS